MLTYSSLVAFGQADGILDGVPHVPHDRNARSPKGVTNPLASTGLPPGTQAGPPFPTHTDKSVMFNSHKQTKNLEVVSNDAVVVHHFNLQFIASYNIITAIPTFFTSVRALVMAYCRMIGCRRNAHQSSATLYRAASQVCPIWPKTKKTSHSASINSLSDHLFEERRMLARLKLVSRIHTPVVSADT